MFILTEKIAPPIPSHSDSDHHLLASSEHDDDLWVKDMIENLAGFARKIGMGKTQQH